MDEHDCTWDTEKLNKKNFLFIHLWVLILNLVSMYIGILYIFTIGVLYKLHRKIHKMENKSFM